MNMIEQAKAALKHAENARQSAEYQRAEMARCLTEGMRAICARRADNYAAEAESYEHVAGLLLAHA